MKLTNEQQKIVEENHNLIYGFIHKKKLDVEEWYDILAIVLCKAVATHDSERGKLSTYFYIMANSEFLIQYNKTKLQKSIPCTIGFDEKIINKELRIQHDGNISDVVTDVSIPPKYKVIIELLLEGYTQKEIAKKLNVPRYTICRALKKIRRIYKNDK